MEKEIKTKDVLIVENSDEFSSWIITEFNKINNVRVAGTVSSVHEGYRFIKKQIPTIVILDLVLSDGSGIKLLKKIREIDLPIIVIVFTNYNFYRKECIKYGSDYFFDKSNEFEDMVNTVRAICGEN
jgi:DNA-binding NarL/FixJ family response regulator